VAREGSGAPKLVVDDVARRDAEHDAAFGTVPARAHPRDARRRSAGEQGRRRPCRRGRRRARGRHDEPRLHLETAPAQPPGGADRGRDRSAPHAPRLRRRVDERREQTVDRRKARRVVTVGRTGGRVDRRRRATHGGVVMGAKRDDALRERNDVAEEVVVRRKGCERDRGAGSHPSETGRRGPAWSGRAAMISPYARTIRMAATPSTTIATIPMATMSTMSTTATLSAARRGDIRR
jgi:hypothetical protein